MAKYTVIGFWDDGMPYVEFAEGPNPAIAVRNMAMEKLDTAVWDPHMLEKFTVVAIVEGHKREVSSLSQIETLESLLERTGMKGWRP